VTPLVSVIIPAYNAAPFLGAAIESVLSQTVTDSEIVVVDDGSTDGTDTVVRGYGDRVRYLRQENAGVSRARNRGIDESRSPWVAFLDADDVWLPQKLERQLDGVGRAPRYGACYSAYFVADDQLRVLGRGGSERRGPLLEDLLLRGNVVGAVSVLCRRELFSMVGGFDPGFSQCADWDMWIRLAQVTEFLYLEEPLVVYRRHASSMSGGAELLERDSRRVLERAFARPELPPALRAYRRRSLARNYVVLSGRYLHAGRIGAALRCGARGLALDPRECGHLLRYPQRRLRSLSSAPRTSSRS